MVQFAVSWFARNLEPREEMVVFPEDKTINQFVAHLQEHIFNVRSDAWEFYWGRTLMNQHGECLLSEFFGKALYSVKLVFPESAIWKNDFQTVDWKLSNNSFSPRWEHTVSLQHDDDIFTVNRFLCAKECELLIKKSELCGYSSELFDSRVRSNDRLMVQSQTLADSIFERVKYLYRVPKLTCYAGALYRLSGVNPCFRLCRYAAGQSFSKHLDGCLDISSSTKSFLSLNIYLNDNFEQGSTRFYLNKKEPALVTHHVKPKTGLALVFNHRSKSYLHDGDSVLKGVKYLLRTDILYTEDEPELD